MVRLVRERVERPGDLERSLAWKQATGIYLQRVRIGVEGLTDPLLQVRDRDRLVADEPGAAGLALRARQGARQTLAANGHLPARELAGDRAQPQVARLGRGGCAMVKQGREHAEECQERERK